MSLQFLEALLSTSTATWREEVLHHVCKRWRVPYEKPTTSQQAKSCEPAASLGQRKDVISLVVKAVVAAEAAIQLKAAAMICSDTGSSNPSCHGSRRGSYQPFVSPPKKGTNADGTPISVFELE